MQTRLQTMQTQQMQRTPAAVTYVSRKSGMPATQGTTTATGYTYGKAASAFKVKAQAKAKARAKTKTYPKLFQGVPVQPPQQPVQAFEVPDGVDGKGAAWTPEQMADAKANAEDLFAFGLREDQTRQVRVNLFGGTVGVDLREFFPAQYDGPNVTVGQMLPTNRGFRLRPDEWELLKSVSGDIDAALSSVIGPPPPVLPVPEIVNLNGAPRE
jgi:hypothetical protein